MTASMEKTEMLPLKGNSSSNTGKYTTGQMTFLLTMAARRYYPHKMLLLSLT